MLGDRGLREMRKVLSIGLIFILLLILAPARSVNSEQRGGQHLEVSAQVNPGVWRLPFVRMGHTQIYDAFNDRIIVFGGWNGQQFFNDVWALDLETGGVDSWSKLNPAEAWPGARGQHTAIYDVYNHRMIVYGGRGYHYTYDDVWALDLQTPGAESWTQLQPAGGHIGPRRYHTAIYDESSRQMIVFGGNRGGALLNDTWSLDLETPGDEAWSQLAVTGSVPAARGQHSAIYDNENVLMVVFGGAAVGGLRNDTWALDLTTGQWVQLSPGGSPPSARRGHTAVLTPGQNSLVAWVAAAFSMTCGSLT